jgi:hypothetical protein
MPNANAETWVVYRMPVKGSDDGMRAVCNRQEWDALERQRPGFYTLIEAGIGSEGEAERLARGRSGETPPRVAKRKRPVGVSDGVPGPVVGPGENQA